MTARRSFFMAMAAFLSVPMFGQKAIMESGKAVVCKGGDTFKCGACGHESCSTIDATMAVGNENRNYPETSVLFEFHFLRCDNCKVLSTRE